jgi:alpha-tubulin suppressor-like RCC1 family protein
MNRSLLLFLLALSLLFVLPGCGGGQADDDDDTSDDDEIEDSSVDVPPTPLPTKLSVGHTGSCLSRNQDTQCWGRIAQETFDPASPFQGLPQGLVNLSVSSTHICGISSDGSVGCWGNNRAGQLAREPVNEILEFETIEGLTNVTSVCTNSGHSCVVANEGAVYCWGNNDNGQVGRPEKDHPIGKFSPEPVPAQVLGLSPAIDVACGSYHSCAVLKDGSSRCWGMNNYGQAGTAHYEENEEGVWLYDPGLTDVSSMVANNYSTCALTQGGKVYCWGRHVFGPYFEEHDLCQAIVEQACLLNPAQVPIEFQATELEFGSEIVCARGVDTALHCWGSSSISTSDYTEEHVQFGLGLRHLCLLREDDSVICRGGGGAGQFGTETEWENDWVEIALP